MTFMHTTGRRPAIAFAAGVALLAGLSVAHGADDEKDAGNASLTPAATAAQLALQGEQRQSPALLLAAAEILADLVVSERDAGGAERETEGGDGAGDDAALPALSVDGLIDRAREIAAEQGDAMVAAVDAMVERLEGDARGIVYWQGKDYPDEWVNGRQFKLIDSGRINPGETIRWTGLMMEGGRDAEVRVIGDGDGDIDLWVYDGVTGRQVASDTDLTSYCIGTWYPPREQAYTVEFTNVGGIWEYYYVIVNW